MAMLPPAPGRFYARAPARGDASGLQPVLFARTLDGTARIDGNLMLSFLRHAFLNLRKNVHQEGHSSC